MKQTANNVADPKTVDAMKMSDEELAKTRKTIREQMREKFDKWMEVSDEDATQEDVEQAKREFEERVDIYKNQRYLISDSDKTEKIVEYPKFIKNWNATCNHWVDAQWKGVYRLDKVMDEAIKQIEDKTVSCFDIDYATLFYLYQVMSHPQGTGLESAEHMAKIENYDFEKDEVIDDPEVVTYSGILQTINKHINALNVADKMLKLYRERINIAIAGIKINWKITELEEFVELHDAWLGESINEN